jgi:hypothetical protein
MTITPTTPGTSVSRVFRSMAVLALALALATCGGGSDDGGGPGPAAPVLPTPAPTPAAPAPEPPLAASCQNLSARLVPYFCDARGPSFQRELDDAINELKAQRPDVFDGDQVLNVGAYIVGIIKNLDAQGVCSMFDGEEIAARGPGDFSDQYDVLTSTNRIRRFYVGTCSPAVFPQPRSAPPPSPAGCNLAPSYEIACGDPPPQFLDDVTGAIEQLVRDRPEIFDAGTKAAGRDWPAVKDFPAYYQGVIEALSRKGYCGRFDGEEIAVKRTNEFSEQYDINYQDRYIRLGPGIYRGACYPAAF